ncbi:MAG: type II toxin-antitoxin system HicA family toxin [Lachnospiraceae bacterium]|nr:type II toxin-antitoxin system HicA family toxin [Lachnospiraceae bacterium]
MTVREIRKILHKDGWYEINQEGSHISLKHPSKPGKVTLPNHNGDLKPGTLNSIYKQAGLKS